LAKLKYIVGNVPVTHEAMLAEVRTGRIAHALTGGMGWGRCDAPEPAYVTGGEKPRPNAGTSRRKGVLPAKRARSLTRRKSWKLLA